MVSGRWRRHASLYRGARGTLVWTILLSIGQSLIVLPITYLVKYAFDGAMPSRDVPALMLVAAGIFLLYVTNVAVTLLTKHLILAATKRVVAALRVELLHRLYAFSRSFYSGTDPGRLHAILVQDTERVDVMGNALLAQVFPALCISLALAGWLAILNWRLLLATLILFPLLLVVNRSMGARLRRHVAAFRISFEAFSNGVLQVLHLWDLTRVQSAERFEQDRQAQTIDHLRVTSGRMAWLAAAYPLVQNAIAATADILILIIGGTAVAKGSMTLGGLASFYVGFSLLARQASVVLAAMPSVIAGDESWNALCRLLDAPDLLPYNGRRAIAFQGSIAVESVDFGYGGRAVLREVSLDIPKHAVVAVMGANGSGKTSLAHLILGFYRPQRGRLLADGHPFDDLDMTSLRQSIGVVMQDTVMLPGTIWDNITYGAPEASRSEVIRVSELATARDFIEAQPQGYDTTVGENGVRLSGGQRQAIMIARALLRKPALLVLDEPTNHLDESSVRQLLQNLKKLEQRPAVVLITHDIAVAREADRLYVLGQQDSLVKRVARGAGADSVTHVGTVPS